MGRGMATSRGNSGWSKRGVLEQQEAGEVGRAHAKAGEWHDQLGVCKRSPHCYMENGLDGDQSGPADGEGEK